MSADYPQPCLETRVQNCINDLPPHMKRTCPQEVLREIATRAVTGAPTYTMSTYNSVGRAMTSKIAEDLLKERWTSYRPWRMA
jgi:hypothetical protein